MRKKVFAILLGVSLTINLISSCGINDTQKSDTKVFNYGTTAYGVEMGNAGLNPHDNYSGWSAVRYGVGETLFKFTDTMELESWLAAGYEQVDEYTVKINLRDNVYFSSGRKLDGAAVKECLEDLIAVHDRAAGDLKIKEIVAYEQSIEIISEEKAPALLNYLSDPYGAIIDMQYGVTSDKNVAGTGPYIAKKVTDTEINLVKNTNYWAGDVNVDEVNIRAVTDGDTLTMALQSGQLDSVQGLSYASLSLFEDNPSYKVSSVDTSRTFFAAINYETEILRDINVRKAIAMGIDKESFTSVLLNGNGTPAIGPFPSNFTFGDNAITAPEYNPEQAKKLLAEAGWIDSDGDGYADKNGQKLSIRWLTYPNRQELPLLAEFAQSTLKNIGIDVTINSTANHLDFIDKGEWDVYASAFVTAPTGDPAYFFTTHALSNSAKNRGHYYNSELENLAGQLAGEFDMTKRSDLAVKMEQLILDDGAFIFASHLKMSFVMKSKVTGFKAHSSDYYEITKDLDVE